MIIIAVYTLALDYGNCICPLITFLINKINMIELDVASVKEFS